MKLQACKYTCWLDMVHSPPYPSRTHTHTIHLAPEEDECQITPAEFSHYYAYYHRISPRGEFLAGGNQISNLMYALERERKIHRGSAGNRTRDLPITSRTLLPLSHWTHGRGAEASLLITAMLEASADSSCLSLSPFLNGDLRRMGLWAWG